MRGRKVFGTFLLLALVFSFFLGPATVFASSNPVEKLDQSIYEQTEDNILAEKVESVVRIVGGVGGVGFVLAVLIITLFIIFGSISANEIGKWWKALFSCIAGAFVFFSAFAFAPAIASLAFG